MKYYAVWAEKLHWPLLSYLLLSYAHFVLRYVLQVCDVGTSPKYGPSPAWLSAMKFGLLTAFLTWSLVSGRTYRLSESQKHVSVALSIGMFISALLCFIKITFLEAPIQVFVGDFWYNWLFAVGALSIPITCGPHQIRPTLKAFSLISFWLCTAFWIFEVANYNITGRLPAVSWPDLVRFGGIMDDPNGYTFLLLLLIALTIGFKGRYWKLRALALAVQIPFTKSLTGIAAAGLFALLLIGFSKWRITSGKVIWTSLILLAGVAIYQFTDERRADASQYIEKMLTLKQQSMDQHVGYLSLPEEIMNANLTSVVIGNDASVPTENFFWHIQLDEGIIGTTIMSIVLGFYAIAVWRSRQPWNKPVAIWLIVIIPASIGLPLFRVFPINTLWWCMAAIVIRAKDYLTDEWQTSVAQLN